MITPAIDPEILLFNQSAGHNPVIDTVAIVVSWPARQIFSDGGGSRVFPCELYS